MTAQAVQMKRFRLIELASPASESVMGWFQNPSHGRVESSRISAMNLRLGVVAAVLSVLVLAGGLTVSPARSDPPADPRCTYTLSAPQVVVVSGTPMVTATLAPFPCTGSISPNSMTVCLKVVGDSNAGQCGFEPRPLPARVFVPYRPGTSYEARGRGCGSAPTASWTTCSTHGPMTVTL